MTGAQIILETLKREGVDVMFGIPGGAVLPIFDELYKRKDIRFILNRHEQAAAHAADGYARSTGHAGVCIVTSGPGATNTVTGIATAYMDSVPIVVLTGQVPTNAIGNDAFQEADIVGITRPITKHNYLVKDVRDLARTIREAFYIATTGRPGPVLIDLPKDVQIAECEFQYPEKIELRGYKPSVGPHPKQVKRVVDALAKSSKPILYAGGGVISSGASEELVRFARATNIPVTTTLLGLGAIPTKDPLFLGMLGMHGTRTANYAIMAADLIISVGARFDDRVTGKISAFAPEATIVHIDIDPSSISKSVPVDIPIVGDAKDVLHELNEAIKGVKLPDFSDWHKQIEVWRKTYPLTYKKDPERLKPQFVVERISQVAGCDSILATDVGQHQMWAAQFFCFTRPRSFLSSGGLGTMGYGFPAAIGAQVAHPDRLVFSISGDGSFQMNIQELATCVLNKIPVKVAVMNNGYLGMVRQWQELFYEKRYSCTCLGNVPDFAKVAEAYGARGLTVTRPDEVDAALEEAVKTDGPVVIDFRVDPEENVFPMVPAGAAVNEMIGGPELA